MRFGIMIEHLFRANPQARSLPLWPGDDVCVAPAITPMGACPPQAKSSTWEPVEEQYVPPDYWNNPFNWGTLSTLQILEEIQSKFPIRFIPSALQRPPSPKQDFDDQTQLKLCILSSRPPLLFSPVTSSFPPTHEHP